MVLKRSESAAAVTVGVLLLSSLKSSATVSLSNDCDDSCKSSAVDCCLGLIALPFSLINFLISSLPLWVVPFPTIGGCCLSLLKWIFVEGILLFPEEEPILHDFIRFPMVSYLTMDRSNHIQVKLTTKDVRTPYSYKLYVVYVLFP